MNKKYLIILNMIMVSTLFGCSSYRPVVDENEQYQKIGSNAAESEIDSCMAKADRYLESHKNSRMLKEAGRGATSGALLGGVLGALSGDSSKIIGGAAIGGGIGAASSAAGVAAKDNLSPDEMKQRYVSNCLKRKNLVVIGWK